MLLMVSRHLSSMLAHASSKAVWILPRNSSDKMRSKPSFGLGGSVKTIRDPVRVGVIACILSVNRIRY